MIVTDKKPFYLRASFWLPQLMGVALCVVQTAIAGPLTKQNVLVCVTPAITALLAGLKGKKN